MRACSAWKPGSGSTRATKLVTVFTAAAILLFACVSAAGASTNERRGHVAAGPAPTSVRLATTSSIATIVLLAMQGNGSLAKIGRQYNTNITLNNSLGSGAITTAFAAGQFDFMFTGPQHAPTLLAQNQDAVELMSIASGGGVYVVGSTKYKATRGRDLKKWAGSNFADSGVGSSTELWLDALLHAGGLTDYTKTPLSLTALYPTFLSGRVDGYSADVGTVAPAIVDGSGFIIADSTAPAAAKLYGAPIPTVNMVGKRAFTTAYPQLTQTLVTGLMATLRSLSRNRSHNAAAKFVDDVRFTLPTNNPYRNDTKTWGTIWRLILPSLKGEQGVYTKVRFAATVKFLRASNGISADAPTPPTSMIDNSFVIKAYKALKLDLPAGVLR
jgi:ABC-type nitrate/sulfonate/bicarbonate transport system substrate-binding protein